jgi:hypothetical protein
MRCLSIMRCHSLNATLLDVLLSHVAVYPVQRVLHGGATLFACTSDQAYPLGKTEVSQVRGAFWVCAMVEIFGSCSTASVVPTDQLQPANINTEAGRKARRIAPGIKWSLSPAVQTHRLLKAAPCKRCRNIALELDAERG